MDPIKKFCQFHISFWASLKCGGVAFHLALWAPMKMGGALPPVWLTRVLNRSGIGIRTALLLLEVNSFLPRIL